MGLVMGTGAGDWDSCTEPGARAWLGRLQEEQPEHQEQLGGRASFILAVPVTARTRILRTHQHLPLASPTEDAGPLALPRSWDQGTAGPTTPPADW